MLFLHTWEAVWLPKEAVFRSQLTPKSLSFTSSRFTRLSPLLAITNLQNWGLMHQLQSRCVPGAAVSQQANCLSFCWEVADLRLWLTQFPWQDPGTHIVFLACKSLWIKASAKWILCTCFIYMWVSVVASLSPHFECQKHASCLHVGITQTKRNAKVEWEIEMEMKEIKMKPPVAADFQADSGMRQRDECADTSTSPTDGFPTKTWWKILQQLWCKKKMEIRCECFKADGFIPSTKLILYLSLVVGKSRCFLAYRLHYKFNPIYLWDF